MASTGLRFHISPILKILKIGRKAKIYVASAMVGVPAGVWTTTKLIYNKPINEGRSHLISFGGLVGSAYAIGITSLTDVESSRAYVLASMLGLPMGTYLGYKLTAGDEYTPGRAAFDTSWCVCGCPIRQRNRSAG